MKPALLFGGLLLIIFVGHVESRYYSNWQDNLSDELDHMSEQLEADAEQREEEAEAREEQLEAEAEAREEQLNARVEAREKQLEVEEQAREKQFQAELDEIRRKCAKKGVSDDIEGYSNQMVTYTNSIDGFRHIYIQTYNPTTKRVSGSYYRINENDPKAEPICGKLDIASTS